MLVPNDITFAFTTPFSPAKERSTEVAEWFGKLKEEIREMGQF